MRNPNAFSWALVLFSFLMLALPGVALAGPKEECSAAYDKTQTLRRDAKLRAAHDQAVSCSRNVCADFIRSDCAKWMTDIDASMPTVVFEVRDKGGRDTTAVSILLDGQPWLDHLDGSAKGIDPGQHSLRYAIPGAAPIDDTVLIREGEKSRKLAVSFAPGGGVSHEETHASVAPWIIGGIGVAALVGGAVTGGLVLHDKSVTDANCFAATKTCNAAGESAASQGRLLGPITTVELAVGGVAVAGAVIWLVAEPRPKKATTARWLVVPVVNTTGAALHVAGEW